MVLTVVPPFMQLAVGKFDAANTLDKYKPKDDYTFFCGKR
jgi:hypothetical protein